MILAMKFEKSMAFLRRIRLNFSLFMTLTPFPDCPGTSPGAIRKGSQGHEQGEIQPDSPQERHALFILHRQYHWCVCCPFSDLWTRLPDTTRVRTPRPPHQPHFRPSLLHPSHSGKHIVRKTHSTLPEQPILQGVREEQEAIEARQRLLNEPFFLIALDFALWLTAAILYAAIFWSFGAGPTIIQRAFLRSFYTGLITTTVAFFVLSFVLL